MPTFEVISGAAIGGGSFLVAEKILTDAQIKALPTNAQEVIAAPGNNKIIIPLYAVLFFDRTGDYTNIAANSYLEIVYDSQNGRVLSRISESLSGISDLLADGQDKLCVLSQPWSLVSSQITGNIFVPTSGNNAPLIINLSNGVSGNLTGGNAANTLKVTVYYVVINL